VKLIVKKFTILLVFTYLVVIGGLSFGTGYRSSPNFLYYRRGILYHSIYFDHDNEMESFPSSIVIFCYDKDLYAPGIKYNVFTPKGLDIWMSIFLEDSELAEIFSHGQEVFFSGYIVCLNDYPRMVQIILTYISSTNRQINLPSILKITVVAIPLSFSILNLRHIKNQFSQKKRR
jgi:hypothetical protein